MSVEAKTSMLGSDQPKSDWGIYRTHFENRLLSLASDPVSVADDPGAGEDNKHAPPCTLKSKFLAR